jgi:hypothetical protein
MIAKPTELVTQAVKTAQTYAEVLPHIKKIVRTADQNICRSVVSEIKKIIKDKKNTPVQKFMALELFQECMMLKNIQFVSYAQTKILERLSILAQKKSSELFRDSNKTQEFKDASDRFLSNLLTYMQIWAQAYGYSSNGNPTPYAILYSKLNEKVQFLAARPQAVHRPPEYSHSESINSFNQPQSIYTHRNPRSSYTEPQPTYSQPKKPSINATEDKKTIDYLENLLVIIEEIDDPYNEETGKELIENVLQIKPELENLLNASLANDNSEQTVKLLQLNERVQKIEEIKNNKLRPVRKSVTKPPEAVKKEENYPKSYEESNRKSVKAPKTDIFENILDLDINLSDSSSQFKTYHGVNPPLFNSPDLKKSPESNLQMFFTGSASSFYPSISQNEDSKFQSEISELKKTIKEKEATIETLNQSLYALRTTNDHLQLALNRANEVIASKEQEIQSLKKTSSSSFKVESKDIDIFNLLGSPNAKIPKKPSEPESDNEKLFKLIMYENNGVFFDNDIVQLGFQIRVDKGVLKMDFYIGNKSDSPLANLALESDRVLGFDITFNKTMVSAIAPSSQSNFEITSKFISPNHFFPKIGLTLEHKEKQLSYTLKLPISIFKYSEPIDSSITIIWKEWNELMFNSESYTRVCPKFIKKLPGSLKFSENILIVTNSDKPTLEKNQFLLVLKLKTLFMALITVQKSYTACEIEARCYDDDLRKSISLLLVDIMDS